jgi:hypothetical protein
VVKGLTHSKKLKEITEFINTLKKGRTKWKIIKTKW